MASPRSLRRSWAATNSRRACQRRSSLRPRWPRVSFWVRRRTSSMRLFATGRRATDRRPGRLGVVPRRRCAGRPPRGPARPRRCSGATPRVAPPATWSEPQRRDQGQCRATGPQSRPRSRCPTGGCARVPGGRIASHRDREPPRRRLGHSQRPAAPAPHESTARFAVCQSRPNSAATSDTVERRGPPRSSPATRPGRQRRTRRRDLLVVLDERADRTARRRATPPPLVPDEVNRAPERRQAHQAHRRQTLGPHRPTATPTRRPAPRPNMQLQRPHQLVVDAEDLHIAQTNQQLTDARRVLLHRGPPPNRCVPNPILEAPTSPLVDPVPAQIRRARKPSWAFLAGVTPG